MVDENDQTRAVPRIFLVPKKANVKFTFKMPYAQDADMMDLKKLKYGDSGDNPLQIYSEDFIVFQEFIPGSGHIGDQSFMKLGHRDRNAVQIIKSIKDGKEYLIDTKEMKNFFSSIFFTF